MNNIVKNCAVIHDICGIGRAALSTIMPIMSIMGCEVSFLPTMILSSHTGGFGTPAKMESSEYMKNHINHWKDINPYFNGIYVGYIPSLNHGEIIKEFIDNFNKKDTVLLVDPILGDGGKLYSSFTEENIDMMKEIIKGANIITPNYTEATLLLGEKYKTTISLKEVIYLGERLIGNNIDNVVITSVPLEDENNKANVFVMDNKGEYKIISTPYIGGSYPGTGDAFTSILLAWVLRNGSLYEGAHKAMNFIYEIIKDMESLEGYDSRRGIPIEKYLRNLI
ncbi:pyridoxamine kinase [Clostridium hydrogeniformans]|uniref:pyridoxamine kinase n=1 Tax=Clostridium hydrogeniformans TaxID=349933 RepID=UPI00047F5C83|nr:pyridoxamine kinase [Clostridium hydrogeniformans]